MVTVINDQLILEEEYEENFEPTEEGNEFTTGFTSQIEIQPYS